MTTKAFTRTKNRSWFKALFLFYLALVAFLCFGDLNDEAQSVSKWLPDAIFGIPIDKCVHFLIFLPFPATAYLAFYRADRWRALVLAILLALCFAFAFEFLQSTLTHNLRTTDPWDFVANTTAITTCSVIMAVKFILSGRKQQR